MTELPYKLEHRKRPCDDCGTAMRQSYEHDSVECFQSCKERRESSNPPLNERRCFICKKPVPRDLTNEEMIFENVRRRGWHSNAFINLDPKQSGDAPGTRFYLCQKDRTPDNLHRAWEWAREQLKKGVQG